MSEEEFTYMFNKRFKASIIGAIIDRVPKSSTKEACNMLGCSKKWLLNNRDLFKSCKVKDKRGTLEFDTSEIVEYKMRF